MKCTNRITKRLLCFVGMAAIFMTGCSGKAAVSNPYPAYTTDIFEDASTTSLSSFTESNKICVVNDVDFGTDQTDSALAEAAGVFNITKREVTYSQNLFEKLYPASTTKIMTAYLVIDRCKPDEIVTVSKDAVTQSADSSVCNLREGDQITVEDLLYGLMLQSGNDAAYALAEHVSGSIEEFSKLMNETARSFGATHTHFVNPHGLPDDDHYTTVYDMYLIFQQALTLEEFRNIISQSSKDITYKNAADKEVTVTWKSTDRYVTGEEQPPEEITVIGGKTGTTNAAGYCLVLYSTNADQEEIISIVFKAQQRNDLYQLMNQILEGFAK